MGHAARAATVGGRSETFQCSFDAPGRRIVRWVGSAADGTAQSAAGPVAELADLVGARASSADRQMQACGYTAVGGHTEGDTSVTFWLSGRPGCSGSRRRAPIYSTTP